MMRKPYYFVICLLLLRVETGAQVGYLWSFDELTAQSDVVVIGTPHLPRCRHEGSTGVSLEKQNVVDSNRVRRDG
jgi:hypothetical protein